MNAHDPVNRPQHYYGDSLEVIDVIEDWGLNFHLGNCLKYILRAPKKGRLQEDLGKAKWYATRAQRDRVIDFIARDNAPFSIGVVQVQVDFGVKPRVLINALDDIHRAALIQVRSDRRAALDGVVDACNLALAWFETEGANA
ncbi:DUF3310 domain-containing protein [Hyphomicrobium sp. DY-1]|uniref:DUF3310 domain-containing protein n=1 Tax=Hyphomicrobium sp. DY-1 TaxID=3075650 RepID=UPI0039C12D8F